MNSRALVNAQIANAIEKLETMCRSVPAAQELRSSSMEDLIKGQVPPIFHALACQIVAAHDDNDDDKDDVDEDNRNKDDDNDDEDGEIDEWNLPCAEKVSAVMIPTDDSDQFLRLKEYGTNFHEAINDQGVPCFQIKDRGENIWEYSKEYTAHICHLVNEKAKMLGNGVESTLLTANFEVDETKVLWLSSKAEVQISESSQ
jgi:hypothetical protein